MSKRKKTRRFAIFGYPDELRPSTREQRDVTIDSSE